MTEGNIIQILRTYVDPYLGMDLFQAKIPVKVNVENDVVSVEVTVGYPFKDQLLQESIKQCLAQAMPGCNIDVKASWKVDAKAVQPGLKAIEGIKNIVAVASGKGGVGKSTTAVNLALALAGEGASVGILDADIYGPNQPQMLGVVERPTIRSQRVMEPVFRYGIQSMSIGYLIDRVTPVVWRGPMVTGALLQLLNDTEWHPLDYLFIDMPPGTGDIQLTLAQKIPVCGSVIVTTPQEVALIDARKGIEMFSKVKIPILGVIENMSFHICSGCGLQEAIFGSGGGQTIAREYDVALLGQLPLVREIREETDSGKPTVVANPTGEIADLYRQIAKKIAGKLSLQTKNYGDLFPKIVIENK